MRGRTLWPRSTRAVIAASMVVVVMAGAALADTRTFADANDTVGKLDIASITQGHARAPSGGHLLTYTMRTYEGWSEDGFGSGSLEMFFSTDGDAAHERVLTVRRQEGELVGSIQRYRDGADLGDATVVHPDRRTVRISFRRRLLGRGLEQYRWMLFASFARPGFDGCNANGNPIIYCLDRHPESGRRRHVIG